MIRRFNIGYLVFILLLTPFLALPEGTRQITRTAADSGRLCIDRYRNLFAFFDAPPEFRINIRIARLNEKISFGIGRITNPDNFVDVQYLVRDPSGSVVMGPSPVPRSGKGFIGTYTADTIGPFPSGGGYDPLQVTPLRSGDYSLEFFYPPDEDPNYTQAGYVKFEFFDITVTDNDGQPLTGRVWSKSWQFNCGPVETPPTPNRFRGAMFILSDDSVLTSINCNGFVGGTFTISSNSTGCSATGDITVDRQSRMGFHTYPQYKVFLSEPDSTVFPTAKARPEIILPVTVNSDCSTGAVDFGVKVTHDGFVEVLIDVDPRPGANPADVTLHAGVLANPGGNGYNTIRWNGIDGTSNPVRSGTPLTATIRCIMGITHLPMYDIEFNDNGYKVEVIRPPGPAPAIFWDDSMLWDGTNVNLDGCSDTAGCHLWGIESGDTNTINSWWYVGASTAPPVNFVLKRSPGMPGRITGDTSFCPGGGMRNYTIPPEPNSTSYVWGYSGTGALINSNSTSATIVFDSLATSGVLSVAGSNPECGTGPPSEVTIIFHPSPAVTLSVPDSACINEPPFPLTGGSPPGGSYFVDGNTSVSFDPVFTGPGSHEVIYNYSDAFGCTNADTSLVFIKSGKECEIVIWVPNAFSPDGDGLNDQFRPTARNVTDFSMSIYDRTGGLLFTTGRPENGWDGTVGGRVCPPGNYVYLITYRSSLSPPENKTLTGNLLLVR